MGETPEWLKKCQRAREGNWSGMLSVEGRGGSMVVSKDKRQKTKDERRKTKAE
jgi:hypothetical protein